MPSIFSHAAAAFRKIYARDSVPFKFWLWSALCAMQPDVRRPRSSGLCGACES